MKILIMGLPGSGKTTFARFLAEHLRCVHFNADDIRENINKDLGFSAEDRVEQARRMGHLCKLASRWGEVVIADFVCPTEETRAAFGANLVVWMDTIKQGRFEDTNRVFVPPVRYDYRIGDFGLQMLYHAREIQKLIAKPRVTVIEHTLEAANKDGLSNTL
jgi:adenylylsulfate kinase